MRRGLRVLALAIRTQPRPFAVAVIGSAGYAGATVGSAMVFGWATDTVISPAFRTGDVTRGTLALVAAVILAVAVAKAAGIVVRKLGALSMQLRLHAIFRKRVSVQYQRLPLTWHRRHTTGELLSNANADVEATFWPVAPLPLSIGVGVMLIAAFGLLIATDLWLAVVGALVFPAIALVNWRYNRAMAAPATRAQQRRAAVSETAHESFDGALVVKTLGREEAETRRFAQRSEELRDDLIRLGRIRAIFDPLMEALPQTGVLAVIAVAAWRIVEGPLSTGDLVQIAYLFTLLAFPLRVLGFLLGDLPRAVVGWERVERVLAADDELPWGDRAATDDNERPAHLNVREASYHYPVTAGEPEDSGRGITSLDLDASPGRVLALVGPTGSGKSTAVSLLVRLADPDHGVVELDGTDLRSLRKDAAAQQTAISFQHPFLFDDTVRGNITLGASFSEQEVRTAAQLAQADGFITALPDGYDTLIGERGTSLSGGQRQRLALARALVRRPRLLILDDATSSVDPQVEAAILSGLREAALPSTVVIVAYREATIALADEVVYIDGGQVVAHGTHADLLARLSAYAHLVGTVDDGPSARPGHLGAPEAASPSRHDDEPSDDRPSARPGHLGAPEAASPSRRDQE